MRIAVMKAMILKRITSLESCAIPLERVDLPIPVPASGEILVKVSVCGVCHTELDEIEGRTAPEHLPRVLGHQVVGRVEAMGQGAEGFSIGDRVGVAWIHSACGYCVHCSNGNENLCADFKATGRDANGGYAEYMTVPAAFAFAIPMAFSDTEATPLLCAGAIGHRSLRLARIEDGQNLGLTGFGASAHLVLKMVRHRFPRVKTFVFARNAEERTFALELGAVWAGAPEEFSPERLDSIIDTTPVWNSVVEALKNLRPGGRLVVNAIRKEEADKAALLRLDYPSHLWMEKEIKSVANVSRADVREFLALAAEIPLRSEVEEFDLEDANRALVELKTRRVRGAKVLRVG
jgi:propanol-preferring alcohol dehydrogenase